MSSTRNRTSPSDIGISLYLYFLGLSTRGVAKAMSFLHKVKRSHVSIWNWIQKCHPQECRQRKRRFMSSLLMRPCQSRLRVSMVMGCYRAKKTSNY